jgi:hypothetical protein
MSTFNGWPVIPMPSYPVAASVDFYAQDSVAVSQSPFTGQAQTQNWQASWLEASVQMPPMVDKTARGWVAWLLATQGINGVFLFGDPLAVNPFGSNGGSITVAAAGQTGYSLAVNGGVGVGCLLAGDYIQVGYRLYRLTAQYDGGSASLEIWPQIREPPASGATVTTVNTQGMFRLKANTRKYSITKDRVYGLQFDIREAI